MAEYTPTIGLEVHAQLKTQTKMFCSSKNDPDEAEPNVNVCPVCMGHPGTLPVVNEEAIRHVVRIGVAVEGKLADFSEFDRKNYFYPDIPKGYQISQYEYPFVSGGSVMGVALTRIHLEEDTARNIHTESGDSLVDFNRAGTPLMELVTEPVISSAQDASLFAKELQLLLRYLGASGANMEKGEMRVEANVSVSKGKEMGTKVEIKNLNSFKSVERGIEYEVKRQIELLESGGEVRQETRGWDEAKGETFSQRVKETSEDYRYFPEPDLPKLKLLEKKEFAYASVKNELPELPHERRERFIGEYGMSEETAHMFVHNKILGSFFEHVADQLKDTTHIAKAVNYIATDLSPMVSDGEDVGITPESFANLITMMSEGELSSRGTKDVLKAMVETGEDPKILTQKLGLTQESDKGALGGIVDRVVRDNSEVVEEYKKGKEQALQYLVGQGMKESKGSANPGVLRELLVQRMQVNEKPNV